MESLGHRLSNGVGLMQIGQFFDHFLPIWKKLVELQKKTSFFFVQTFFKKSYFLLYDYVFLSFIHILKAIADSQVLEFF